MKKTAFDQENGGYKTGTDAEFDAAYKKALDELEQVSGDEKIRRIAELREKAIRDEKASMAYAINKGLQQGLQQGIQQGIQQGLQQGLKKGREQGKEERDIEIVKNMLKESIDKDVISNVTGLTEEEIDDISEQK